MSEPLPLSASLSRALVAFTIELDNTWESRVPHRTTRFGGPRGGVYATSLAMWSNFMRAIPAEGVPVAELEQRVRARLPLDGMRRWRYVTIAADPDDPRPKVPRRDWRITPTGRGARAQSVWRGLPHEIEARWAERFGADVMGGLRSDLEKIVGALVLAYEADSDASLSYSANVLRILDEDGVQIARLPRRSGVAPESLRVAVGILAKRRFIAVGADPGGGRLKLARLLGPGLAGQALYDARPAEIEADWCRRVGEAPVHRLRASLERLVTAPEGGRAPVCEGLEPPAGTWRSRVPAAEVLPDFPMPRQSGHPDGA